MIGRANRFHGRNSLNFVYRHGETVRMEGFSLRYSKNKKGDYRLAIVVSKKVSKLAVRRNRIRRRIYEAVRLAKKDSGTLWPYDMVISIFDDRFVAMPPEQLAEYIERMLQKSNIQPKN